MHWDEMRTCYHDDAYVVVSWMKGGVDAFIEGSRKRPAPAKHKIFDTLVWKKRGPRRCGVHHRDPDPL